MSTAEDRMQNYIEELEQENRLLRARNTRLERESEMRRLALLDTLKETPCPCDMGSICAGCTPRSVDGSCPHIKPNLACDCYVKGFNGRMKEMEGMEPYTPTAQPAPVQYATFPEGYALHELPADYTGKLWIEGQVRYLHQLTAAQPVPVQEPEIVEVWSEDD